VGSTFNNETGKGQCKSCPAGKTIKGFEKDDHDNQDDCVPDCETNQYVNNDNSKCLECQDGYSCDGFAQTECDAGTFCKDGRKKFCPAGKFGEAFNAPNEAIGCSNCTAGRFQIARGQTSCTKCEAGLYSNKVQQILRTDCKSCTVLGHYCPEGTSFATEFPCPNGTYSNEDNTKSCKICTQGLYQPKPGQQSCLGCPIGQFLADQGVSSVNHDDTSDCQVCPSNTYNDLPGQEKCKGCPVDHIIQDTTVEKHDSIDDCKLNCDNTQYKNSTHCIDCGLGFTCDGASKTGCSAGYFCKDGVARGCPAGTFGNEKEQSNVLQACVECPKGYYQVGVGQPSCTECSEGKFSNVLPSRNQQ